jgi:hypothetical protein
MVELSKKETKERPIFFWEHTKQNESEQKEKRREKKERVHTHTNPHFLVEYFSVQKEKPLPPTPFLHQRISEGVSHTQISVRAFLDSGEIVHSFLFFVSFFPFKRQSVSSLSAAFSLSSVALCVVWKKGKNAVAVVGCVSCGAMGDWTVWKGSLFATLV